MRYLLPIVFVLLLPWGVRGQPPVMAGCRCGCAVGVACTCNPDCPCGATCPGADYDAAYKLAVKLGKPLIVWVGQPSKAMKGCVVCRATSFPDMAGKGVVVSAVSGGRLLRLRDLPGTPTLPVIRDALEPPVIQSPARAATPQSGLTPTGGFRRVGRSC